LERCRTKEHEKDGEAANPHGALDRIFAAHFFSRLRFRQ
jgi:hypothetical protein